MGTLLCYNSNIECKKQMHSWRQTLIFSMENDCNKELLEGMQEVDITASHKNYWKMLNTSFHMRELLVQNHAYTYDTFDQLCSFSSEESFGRRAYVEMVVFCKSQKGHLPSSVFMIALSYVMHLDSYIATTKPAVLWTLVALYSVHTHNVYHCWMD